MCESGLLFQLWAHFLPLILQMLNHKFHECGFTVWLVKCLPGLKIDGLLYVRVVLHHEVLHPLEVLLARFFPLQQSQEFIPLIYQLLLTEFLLKLFC